MAFYGGPYGFDLSGLGPFWPVLLLFVASRFYFRWRREKRIESARQDYEHSLSLLYLKPDEEEYGKERNEILSQLE